MSGKNNEHTWRAVFRRKPVSRGHDCVLQQELFAGIKPFAALKMIFLPPLSKRHVLWMKIS